MMRKAVTSKITTSAMCRLCAKNPPIKNSHILPKLIISAISRKIGDRGFREMSTPRRRVEQTMVDALLCKACERKFSKLESEFAQVYLHPYLENDSLAIVNKPALLSFAISVLWRVLAITLDRSIESASFPYLKDAETQWRNFLNGTTEHLGEHKCYLVLDRDFTPEDIRSSMSLSRVDLRFTIAQGISASRNFIGIPTRHIVYAKLGPFILIGLLRDFFGKSNSLAEQWPELKADGSHRCFDTGKGLPESIIGLTDEILSQWQWNESLLKPAHRKDLQNRLDKLPETNQLKELARSDKNIFTT